jgi:signal transduction histidine kinase
MESSSSPELRKLFFGTIRKKLIFSFGILIFLMVLLATSNYYINFETKLITVEIRDISAPMDLMIEQIVGYDALLTGAVHESLLHASHGEFDKMSEHKAEYDAIGVKLDNLLKKDYVFYLEKTSMSPIVRSREEHQLAELDKVNLELVDLETSAFDSLSKGDVNSAYDFVVSDLYHEYKGQLNSIYNSLAQTQMGYTNGLRTKASTLSKLLDLINGVFAFLIIVVGVIVAFFMAGIISKPIKELHSAVREISKGNFKMRVNIQTHDELAEFGDAFNNMSSALSETEEKRRQIDKVKTEFLSITSHELRSPMTPMRAQLQMLLGGYFGKLSAKQKESVEIVLRNTERLDKILLDFLEISRIEAARLKFSFTKTNLGPHVKRVVEELRGFMPEKHFVIELKMPELPDFEVDPDRVMQVLRNLINNAVKFVPDTGGKITVSVQPKEDYLLFMVKDNGVGIGDENKKRIFEPFFQEEQTMYRKYQGTGLGLAICRGIIESQKGKIWFDSIRGKGTTFYFTVPFIPVKEIAPIRVLFSERAVVDDKLKKLLIDYLGPLGKSEFEKLSTQSITQNTVMDYAQNLCRIGVIAKKEEFIKEVSALFNEKSDVQ